MQLREKTSTTLKEFIWLKIQKYSLEKNRNVCIANIELERAYGKMYGTTIIG